MHRLVHILEWIDIKLDHKRLFCNWVGSLMDRFCLDECFVIDRSMIDRSAWDRSLWQDD